MVRAVHLPIKDIKQKTRPHFCFFHNYTTLPTQVFHETVNTKIVVRLLYKSDRLQFKNENYSCNTYFCLNIIRSLEQNKFLDCKGMDNLEVRGKT